MKSTARLRWPILILTLLACVAGFFLRRSQLASLLEDGSVAPGSRVHIYLLILVLAAAAALAVLIYPLLRQQSWKSVFDHKPAFQFLHLPAAVALLVGNLILLITGEAAFSVFTIAAFVVLAGLLYLVLRKGYVPKKGENLNNFAVDHM